MDPYNGGETSPGPVVTTDDEIRDWVARDAETALHPSCTARMGTDDGVGRRSARRCASTASTACASWTPRSMPYVTNGNIYAPVMMIAEKAADLILGDTPLPAEHTPVLPPRARDEAAGAVKGRKDRRR